MLFYDWRKICKVSGGSSRRIVVILRVLVERLQGKTLPRSTYDEFYKYRNIDFSGYSFLINPVPLLKWKYKPKEVADYLGLASLRSYSHYSLYKDARLEMDMVPISIDVINNNKLLKVSNNELIFKYEEL